MLSSREKSRARSNVKLFILRCDERDELEFALCEN